MSSSHILLKGQKVLVIGGSSGIGRSVAAASLANGASVVIASSSQTKVQVALDLLKSGIEGQADVSVSGETFDIRDYVALTKFLTTQAPFDHLVITTGESPRSYGGPPPPDVDLRERLKDIMDARYWAVLNAAVHIHHHKLIRPGGSLTHTIGTSHQRPIPGYSFYTAGVGAAENATRGLSVDLKPLRINAIAPGLVDSEFFQNFPDEERIAKTEIYRKKLLVGRLGTPDEVAEAYIFAMKCGYLTGQVLTVDGGGVLA